MGSRELGSGEGKSKKAAEQLAAEAAWRAITAEAEARKLAGSAEPAPDEPGADGPPAPDA